MRSLRQQRDQSLPRLQRRVLRGVLHRAHNERFHQAAHRRGFGQNYAHRQRHVLVAYDEQLQHPLVQRTAVRHPWRGFALPVRNLQNHCLPGVHAEGPQGSLPDADRQHNIREGEGEVEGDPRKLQAGNKIYQDEHRPGRHLLAVDRTRFVGNVVAGQESFSSAHPRSGRPRTDFAGAGGQVSAAEGCELVRSNDRLAGGFGWPRRNLGVRGKVR